MLSLYIHIPFCTSRCSYCSFNTMAIDPADGLIDEYILALKREIDHYGEVLTDKKLKTVYFGGGTPGKIGSERIIDIIEYIKTRFHFEDIAELSIELNPYPEEETLAFVKTLNKKYEKVSRLRYSFGIQSFDEEVLKTVGRAYNFNGIVEFLRSLTKLKQDNNVFNFDFIAFGMFQVSKNGFKQLWHEYKREFLEKFLASGYVDSVSLYTLEGIGDQIKNNRKLAHIQNAMTEMPCPTTQKRHGNDEEIMEEFLILKEIIEHEGFIRSEISNFAKAGKISIHNMVYWNMEPYLGLGLSAASFMPCHSEAKLKNISDKLYPSFPSGGQSVRRTNTQSMKYYLEGDRKDEKEVHILNASDLLIEEFFLRLRTREGIADITKFTSVLVPNYQGLISNYQGAGLVHFEGSKLSLTNEGMNVYNSIVTDLLQKI